MNNTIIYMRCEQCKGVGTWTPEGQETISCVPCRGTGQYAMTYFNIDSIIDSLNVKLDNLTDKTNDILDKCNDIKEKCDEIFDEVKP